VIAPRDPQPKRRPVDAGTNGGGQSPQPATAGGQGEILTDPHHMRSDARLVTMAARRRWPVSNKTRRAVCDRLAKAVTDSPDDSVAISAAKALAAIDGLNIKREQGPASSVVNVGVSVTLSQSVEAALSEPEYLAWLEGRGDTGVIRADGQ